MQKKTSSREEGRFKCHALAFECSSDRTAHQAAAERSSVVRSVVLYEEGVSGPACRVNVCISPAINIRRALKCHAFECSGDRTPDSFA